MGVPVRWASVAVVPLTFFLIGSCGLVDGLGQYSAGECTGACDGSADRSVVEQNPKDGVAADDAIADDAVADATNPVGDSPVDTDDSADDVSAPIDAGPEAAAVVDAGGPVAEAGCGALDTAANCSACGTACSTSTGTPSCNGSTCSYSCNANRQDCNASKAPDTDGCECAGSGCCSGKCQTAHSNGASGTYYDCTATGTINKTQATEACTAATGSSSACSDSTTGCGCIIIVCSSQAQSVCGASGGKCYCWQYSGPSAGTVQESSGSSCSASCGSTSDTAWN